MVSFSSALVSYLFGFHSTKLVGGTTTEPDLFQNNTPLTGLIESLPLGIQVPVAIVIFTIELLLCDDP